MGIPLSTRHFVYITGPVTAKTSEGAPVVGVSVWFDQGVPKVFLGGWTDSKGVTIYQFLCSF